MKLTAVLAIACFFAPQAVPQNARKTQSEAECKFSGGKGITITYSLSERIRGTTLRTNEDLATVQGVNIPPGEYELHTAKDSHDNWFLNMTRVGKGESLRLPPVPLSAKQPASPVLNFNISFDHTGGTCRMHWDSEESSVLLSLDFTQKNSDVPVIP